MHACLEQYLAEGPDTVAARHQAAARAARAGVRALGLRLWAADEAICADTVTAVAMPPGVSEADVRAIARSESGVMLSGGQGGPPVLQIGHMGPAAHPLAPVIAVVALGRALRRAGAAADVGAAVEAVLGEDSYRGAIKPECHPGTESDAGRCGGPRMVTETSGFGSRP